MRIERPEYLNWLLKKRGNRRIKVVSGLRRCGKSYLLSELFRAALMNDGILSDHIIYVSFEGRQNAEMLNPLVLEKEIKARIQDEGQYIVILDEVSRVYRIMDPIFTDGKLKILKEEEPGSIWFPDIVLGLNQIPNVDIYISGSNSKFLAKDIVTEMRDRVDVLQVNPLSFREISRAFPDTDSGKLLDQYLQYGGMPVVWELDNPTDKRNYLNNLLTMTYTADLIERYKLKNGKRIEKILQVLADSLGSLVNPTTIANTFVSSGIARMKKETIFAYLSYMKEVYLIQEAERFDIKGRKTIGAAAKYYFSDIGLRNVSALVHKADYGHIMENVIYNELIGRGYVVQIGTLNTYSKDSEGKTIRQPLEIDFIASKSDETLYIQAAWEMTAPEQQERERKPLLKLKNNFSKLVITREPYLIQQDEDGIQYIDLKSFLLSD